MPSCHCSAVSVRGTRFRRANALKTAGGGVGLCASYRLPFDSSLIVNDSSSGIEGTRAVILAADHAHIDASKALTAPSRRFQLFVVEGGDVLGKGELFHGAGRQTLFLE